MKLSEKAGKRAVQGLSISLGNDDPMTLNAMFNLARTYLHTDRLEESHQLLRTVVRKRRAYFGAGHPETLMARNEFGLSLRALGRLSAAERVITNVL